MTHVTINMLKAFQINEKGKPPSPPHNRDRVNNTKVSTFDSITLNVLQEHSFQIEFSRLYATGCNQHRLRF